MKTTAMKTIPTLIVLSTAVGMIFPKPAAFVAVILGAIALICVLTCVITCAAAWLNARAQSNNSNRSHARRETNTHQGHA